MSGDITKSAILVELYRPDIAWTLRIFIHMRRIGLVMCGNHHLAATSTPGTHGIHKSTRNSSLMFFQLFPCVGTIFLSQNSLLNSLVKKNGIMTWPCDRRLTHRHPQDVTNQQIAEAADLGVFVCDAGAELTTTCSPRRAVHGPFPIRPDDFFLASKEIW
jgi:hypothetical protein